MKKFFSGITLCCLLISLAPSVQAMESGTLRSDLSYYEGGIEFIERVDTILPAVQASSLMALENRIGTIMGMQEMEEMSAMKMHFLNQEIKKELHKRSQSSVLTSSEIQAIESEILTIQRDFLDGIEKSFSELLNQVTETISTREIGNMQGEFYYNIPFFGELEAYITLSDYIADTESLTSSRFRSDIEVSLTSFGEKIKSSLTLDFIIKENDVYLLIEDLEIHSDGNILEEWGEIVDIINALGQTNTYLHIGNGTSELEINIGDILSITNLENQEWYQVLQNQALLSPAGKIGNTYFMTAHEELCHISKTLMAVFDPFSAGRCTSRQLENFRSEMLEILDVRYVKSGRIGRLNFSFMTEDITPASHVTIEVLGGNFQSLSWSLEDSSAEMLFSGKYIAGENLLIGYRSNFWGSTSEFIGDFSFSDTTLDTIDMIWDYQDSWSDISSTLQLRDGKISGSLHGREDGEDIVHCSLNGIMSESYLELDGSCRIDDGFEKIEIDMTLEYDTRENTNNFSLTLNGKIDSEDFMGLSLKNTATRQEVSNLQITAPRRTISLEELLERAPIIGNMLFGNTSSWEDDWEWENDFEIIYNEGEDYSETCYTYDNGEIHCYKYFDDGTMENCMDLRATSGEMFCNYVTDEYYYSGDTDTYFYFD